MRTQSRLLVCLVPTLLLFALAGVAWAIDLPSHAAARALTLPAPLVIDASTHHLGDQDLASFDVPTPEGTVYTTTFALTSSDVQNSFLRVETYNVEGAHLVQLNGTEIGTLPGTWLTGWQPTVLSVPGTALQAGVNTLVISSTRFSAWQLFELWYDDVMFRQVELLPSQTPFSDEFGGSTLEPRWDWVDLLEDSAYDLTTIPGHLVMDVPTSTTVAVSTVSFSSSAECSL